MAATVRMLLLDGHMVAALEQADGHHHVQFAHAQPHQRRRLLAQRGDQRRAQRKANYRAHGNARAGQLRSPPSKPTPGSPWRRRNGSESPPRTGSPPGRGWRRALAACGRSRRPAPASSPESRGECRGIEAPVVEVQVRFLHGNSRTHGGLLLAGAMPLSAAARWTCRRRV